MNISWLMGLTVLRDEQPCTIQLYGRLKRPVSIFWLTKTKCFRMSIPVTCVQLRFRQHMTAVVCVNTDKDYSVSSRTQTSYWCQAHPLKLIIIIFSLSLNVFHFNIMKRPSWKKKRADIFRLHHFNGKRDKRMNCMVWYIYGTFTTFLSRKLFTTKNWVRRKVNKALNGIKNKFRSSLLNTKELAHKNTTRLTDGRTHKPTTISSDGLTHKDCEWYVFHSIVKQIAGSQRSLAEQ